MISTSNLTLGFGVRPLFENVNIKFTPGNCYGLIGANGAGKSTFLKILSGEIEANSGDVIIPPGVRLSVLKQDHFEFDEYEVIQTVLKGHARLYAIMEQKDSIYAKADFSEEDGLLAAELEGEFAELNGWEAEAEAATLLNGLGITEALHNKKMQDLIGSEKVKVLLAQALFGHPDILLLDEPTNHLDIESISWLEDFLYDLDSTVIVVSHDRHFLNSICTHIADIDYGKIQLYVGNYDFWMESSQLAMQQAKDANKKADAKIKELEEFIRRFSANASKSKQATSRKRQLEKLTPEDIRPSSRRLPWIQFKPNREAGVNVLTIHNLNKTIDGEAVLKDFNLVVNRGDKIALVGPHEQAKTTLLAILMGEMEADSGEFNWGLSTSRAYFPRDYTAYFDSSLNLVNWLRQYSQDQEETFIRGFLGRMLFSGDESQKQANVLSGGEQVRCMMARMMLTGANVLLLDEPTNHLDLEAITALNKGLTAFDGNIFLVSHDHQLLQTVANRIIEITPDGVIDRLTTYDEYLEKQGGKSLARAI
ncbi:MAG TPA: ATP-binding cassette domain-containing protein [Syntrophomonadaceae bacterium]|nr:ATP-binding cassette domain-containing protein [Syntrophomonadaceae bacterium]